MASLFHNIFEKLIQYLSLNNHERRNILKELGNISTGRKKRGNNSSFSFFFKQFVNIPSIKLIALSI